MNPLLVNIAIQLLPQAIKLAKELFKRNNPDLPQPSDEEVISAYQVAGASSLAKDEAWLAAHPQS